MKWLTGPVLFLASLLLSVFLFEIFCRIFFPAYSPEGEIVFRRADAAVPIAEPGFDGFMWKNTGDYKVRVQINKYGFRDEKDLASSTLQDLFVAGDSFAFGHGVEARERFSDRLEEKLGARVFNIAIPTDIAGYRRLVDYAEQRGASIRRLIVAVCMENDLQLYGGISKQEKMAAHTSEREPRTLAWGKELLTYHSTAYRLLTSLAHQNEGLKSALIRAGLVSDDIKAALKNVYSPELITQSVEELQKLTSKYAALVVLIPSRMLWTGGNEAAERRVHEEFAAALRAAGIWVLDLRPAWEIGKNPFQYHFKNDGHWNAAGHELAAALIARELSVKASLDLPLED